MRYWAALTAYEDANEDCPVFVALASYAAFVDAGLKNGKGGRGARYDGIFEEDL